MKRINTSPISGMQELLPSEQATFNNLKTKIAEVYHRHGFVNIETPVIDRTEILLAKAGGDTEKQIYRVVKTAESADGADQALRFDHTVPLARYVVEHENDLTFPFKVSQIGRNYRGERAQKGRYREFYQCDVDIIGRGELPVYFDADIISTLIDTYAALGIKAPVVARINNRKILTGLLKALKLEEKSEDIYSIIDHSEKVPEDKTESALYEIGLSDESVQKLLAFMNLHGSREFVMKNLGNLGVTNETFDAGLMELDQVMYTLENDGYKDVITADMKIVRGLDYYTGTVFEFNLDGHMEIGSIGGGGRYENLASYFTEQKLPGVGGSIGLTRLFYVLSEHKLLNSQVEKPVEMAVVPISENEINYALEVARELRDAGKTVTMVYSGKKLGDKLSYAAKIANSGVVIGENEVNSKKYEIRQFN